MVVKRQSLGKGLDALLGFSEDQVEAGEETRKQTSGDGVLLEIPVEFLQRGKYQPRRDLNPQALQELANSISKQGVMQPIVVRKLGENKYEIMC